MYYDLRVQNFQNYIDSFPNFEQIIKSELKVAHSCWPSKIKIQKCFLKRSSLYLAAHWMVEHVWLNVCDSQRRKLIYLMSLPQILIAFTIKVS